MRLSLSALLAILAPLAATSAAAGGVCRVDVRPVVFGSIEPMRSSYGKGTVVVTCDGPARFEVAIGEEGGGIRRLIGPAGERLRYGLYRDPSYSSTWGDGGSLGPAVAAAPHGERPVRLKINWVLPPPQGAPPGAYVSQMTVILRY
jgi:spore coat protein U-like protein